ncbi:hypothetical protein [Orrella sp. 11846]|uniref:hypothetical protein n=1 Tax=Orrella sp. 11846 TaxID=3409913 RepID=UPI003B59EB68
MNAPHKNRTTRRTVLLLVGLLFLGCLLFALWLVFRPVAWQLTLLAKTEVTHLDLRVSQKWLLDDAVICMRMRQAAGVGATDTETNLWVQNDKACEGRHWARLNTGVPEDGQATAIHLFATSNSPLTVHLETTRAGELLMTVRHSASDQILGEVFDKETGKVLAVLNKDVNITWPAISVEELSSRDELGVIVLPFSGSLMVGQDISWGTQHMLLSGEIAVYSASEDHLTGRTVAEHSVLMLGDRVNFEAPDTHSVIPKGFLRIDRLDSRFQESYLMEVVAHAPAEQVVIQRFGGGDYKFEAGWWVRLKHQSSLVIVLLILTGLLSIMSSLVSVIPACRQFFSWCRLRFKKTNCGSDTYTEKIR